MKDGPTCVVLLPFFVSLVPHALRLPLLAVDARNLRNRHPTPVFKFRSTYAETTNSAMLATPTNAGLLALSCPPSQLAAVFTLHTRVRRRKSPSADPTSGTVERSAFLILNPTTISGLPSFYPAFNLMALFTPFLPRFYPVLEGKLCRGKTEAKNGVNSLYPRVKPG